MSTGIADTYSSPRITVPLLSLKPSTHPFEEDVRISSTGEFKNTRPPLLSMYSCRGLQSLVGALPSRKAYKQFNTNDGIIFRN